MEREHEQEEKERSDEIISLKEKIKRLDNDLKSANEKYEEINNQDSRGKGNQFMTLFVKGVRIVLNCRDPFSVRVQSGISAQNIYSLFHGKFELRMTRPTECAIQSMTATFLDEIFCRKKF